MGIEDLEFKASTARPSGDKEMLSVKGFYDGEVAKPFKEVRMPKGVEVIITFLTEKKEEKGARWFETLPIDREKMPRSLEKVQTLLASIQTSLAQTIVEEREERP